MKHIAPFLDCAKHAANTTHEDIDSLCQAVLTYQFNSAFVNPSYIAYARQQLQSKAKVGTVISFPLGQDVLEIKLASVRLAAQAGADELDISANVSYIKEALWDTMLDHLTKIVACAREINPHIIVKFIPETGYLTPDEIQKTAEIMVQAGADFFKTCSGMGPRGATIQDVQLVRAAVGSAIKIKVAGGISTYQQACAFLDAGADRIGTSKAVEIIKEAQKLERY